MRIFLLFILLTSKTLFASNHEMKLTFIDGYNNQILSNKEVNLKIINPEISKNFITDSNGSIFLTFKSGNKIEYHIDFTSGDFESQTRERYFDDEKNADITIYLYPSKTYESRIEQEESKMMARYAEITLDSKCALPTFPDGMDAIQNHVYENLQTPYNYGDYGFEAHFKIEFTLDPEGKPYLISIVESTDENLNSEAIRLIRSMPTWIMNDCDGKKYKRKMTLSLEINLNMG